MRPERTPFIATHLADVPQVASNTTLSVDAARAKHLAFAVAAAKSGATTYHPRCSASRRTLFLEFGVRDGRSISHLARLSNSTTWHGFDSFRGLPEEIASTRTSTEGNESKLLKLTWRRGIYTRSGRRPSVPHNVALHGGWFNQTLPTFLDSARVADAAVAFAHLDADLYSSTAQVLWSLGSRCRLCAGTVLAFDELFGSAAVEAKEWRALRHAARCFGYRFQFISYMAHPRSAFGRAAVQLTEVPPPPPPGQACGKQQLHTTAHAHGPCHLLASA